MDLPSRTPPAFAAVMNREDRSEPVDRSPEDAEPGETVTVLVVDDDADMLEARSLLLEMFGYRAILVGSGEKALDVVRAGAADVVLLDYMMPGIDGLETARRIRELDSAIPIVLTSGCLAVPQVACELVNAFLPKNLPADRLAAALRQQAQHARKGDVLIPSASQS